MTETEKQGELKKQIEQHAWAHDSDQAEQADTKFIYKVLDAAKTDLDQVITEIENNATEDTLFERMVLTRLKNYRKKWFGSGNVEAKTK